MSKKSKRSDKKSQLNQSINPSIGLFDEEPRATFNKATPKGKAMNPAFIQATRIRKRILSFHRATQKGHPFIDKQSHSFKKGLILLAMNHNLFDEDFIQSFQVLTINRRLYGRETGLVTNMSDSPHLDLIFVYAVEKIHRAIRENDLLILGPAEHPRLPFTEEMQRYGKEMMTIKQLNDHLDFVYKYVSSTGLARTDDRSRKQDLKKAYSLYLAMIENKHHSNLKKLGNARTEGLLFICVSLFLTHEKITEQIVNELIDLGGKNYKAMVPDVRIFIKIAKKTKAAEAGSRFIFLECFIHKVLEIQELPTI